jgi:hypothetical protein
VEVRRNEGVAIHIGPKPCAGIREDVGEASAGERIGQPLSRESGKSQGTHGVSRSEGNTVPRAIASVRVTLRGLRPGMYGSSLYGNREISSPIIRMTG